jgi:hypothetical protein
MPMKGEPSIPSESWSALQHTPTNPKEIPSRLHYNASLINHFQLGGQASALDRYIVVYFTNNNQLANNHLRKTLGETCFLDSPYAPYIQSMTPPLNLPIFLLYAHTDVSPRRQHSLAPGTPSPQALPRLKHLRAPRSRTIQQTTRSSPRVSIPTHHSSSPAFHHQQPKTTEP